MPTLPYKNKKSSRVITDLVPFQKGMFFSNQPQDPGTARVLVNYDLIDNGKALRLRSGVTVEDTEFTANITVAEGLWNPARASVSHYAGPLSAEQDNGNTEVIDAVIGFGAPEIEIFGDYVGQVANDTLLQVCWTNLDGLLFSYGGEDREYSGTSGWAYLQNKKGQKAFPGLGGLVGIKGREVIPGELKPVMTVLDGHIMVIGTEELPVQDIVEGALAWETPEFTIKRIDPVQTVDPLELDVEMTMTDLVPYVPTAAQAILSGVNMLAEEPYEFPNVQGSIDAKYIIPYAEGTAPDVYGDIKFAANTGEKIRFALIYGYVTGKTHKVRWDIQSPMLDTTDWVVLENFTPKTVGATAPIYFDYTPPYSTFTLRATIRENDIAATERVVILPYVLNETSAKSLITQTNYDLTTAKGMYTHKGMLGLFGVDGFEHGLFFSDVSNPGYFPFPGNIEWVEGTILNVVNYLDSLLIITQGTIYIMSGIGLLSGYSTKAIITKLNIKPIDALNVRVIKDQIFFKSDNKYYVLKPNVYTSDAADLKNYEISGPIQEVLDNFEPIADEILTRLYGVDYAEESEV